jgi:hypothetical protein
MNYAELHKPLYHGSETSFSKIDLLKSAPKKDFGQGFYTTNDKFQAEKFARLKAKRMRKTKGYVEVFYLQNHENLNIKYFTSANEEWFGFVLNNRGYRKLTAESSNNVFDIVIGPVANDAVGLVLNQFIAGVYGDPASAEAGATAIRLLLTQKLHNQVFFGTEKAISRLNFAEVYDVYID